MTEMLFKPDLPDGSDVASILGELEGLLARQVDLTRLDDLDGASALSDRVAVLLGRLFAVGRAAVAPHTGRIARIRTLHRTLGLMLAQRKHEHTNQQAHLARGRTFARTYAQHTRPSP